MCMWSENEAGKGSNEIASCLLRHFQSTPTRARHLIAWSDSCGGQNKNYTTVAFWWYVIESGKFDTIEHKFPKPGHTFMPIYSDFGKIETKGESKVKTFIFPLIGKRLWEKLDV